MKHTVLDVVKDSYANNQDVFFATYVGDKYSLCFEDLKISSKDKNKVLKKIREYNPSFVEHNFEFSVFHNQSIIESDNVLVSMIDYENKKKVQISLFFNSYEDSKHIFEIIREYRNDEEELFINISSFCKEASGNISYSDVIKVSEDYKNNSYDYYPFLETKELFDQFSISESNILMLCGSPGTGKCLEGSEEIEIEIEDSIYKKYFT